MKFTSCTSATARGWRWAKLNPPKNKIMNDLTQSRWLPIVLLTCSNIFMTFAWYGHLKFKDKPLLLVILASWGIAFFEYCCRCRPIGGAIRFIPPRSLKSSRRASLCRCSSFSQCFICTKKSGGITLWRLCASWRRWRSRSGRRSDYRRRGNEAHFLLNNETPHVVSCKARRNQIRLAVVCHSV